MNSRAKGNFYERKAKEELIADGYRVYRVKGATKFVKEVDMFGLFDMLALKKIQKQNSPLFHIARRFIQVKTNKKLSQRELAPFKDFKKNYTDAHDSVEIHTFWQQGKRKKKKGWEKIILK